MSNDTQPPLFELPEPELPPDPLPKTGLDDRVARVYVASTLTRLKNAPREQARMLESELDTITQAIETLHFDGGLDLSIEPYAPIEHSSAHRHTNLTPEQVFRQNCLQVLTRSDGLIVHGWEPGAGVGQEFAWAATQAAVPVLWLQHGDLPVSRQIRGTPGDVTFKRFQRPADLRRIVQDWLRSRRVVLGAGPYRRATRELRWRGSAAAAHALWTNLGVSERKRICATWHVMPDIIELYLSDALLLAIAPAWILDLLSVEGLLAAPSSTHYQPGRLTTHQLLALAEASVEYEWEPHVVDYLRVSAEQLLAEPATRRFKLETPADWIRLRESLRP